MSVLTDCTGWLLYATKWDKEQLEGVGLSERQVVDIGSALAENTLLNPPRATKLKTQTFKCACPCGLEFTLPYMTKKRRFASPAHKQRYLRSKDSSRVKTFYSPVSCTSCMQQDVVSHNSSKASERIYCEDCLEFLIPPLSN